MDYATYLSYFEDGEIDNICGYSLEKWRNYVKIKKSGVIEIYVTDKEIKEAYEACPDDLKANISFISIFRKSFYAYP